MTEDGKNAILAQRKENHRITAAKRRAKKKENASVEDTTKVLENPAGKKKTQSSAPKSNTDKKSPKPARNQRENKTTRNTRLEMCRSLWSFLRI